jgi:hypothetical protein
LLLNESPLVFSTLRDLFYGKKVDIIEFHKMLGHCSSDRLEKTAKIHDFKTCEQFATAKARRNNVNKDWKGGSQVQRERLYLDISSIKDLRYGGSKFWAFIVDDYTDYCWRIFLTSKSDLKKKIFTLLTDLKISGIDIKFICYDDSGESKSFNDSCRANGHNIKFEFSGPRTPQRDGKVERKFQTFYGRIRATLNNGELEDSIRTGVWVECARVTTFLSNITSIKAKHKCPYELMFGIKTKLKNLWRNGRSHHQG